MSTIEIVDGTLEFQVTVNGQTSSWITDVLTLKLISQEIEEKHGMTETSNRLDPSLSFLTDLAAAFVDNGCPACEPSQAFQIWMLVFQRFFDIRTQLSKQLASA